MAASGFFLVFNVVVVLICVCLLSAFFRLAAVVSVLLILRVLECRFGIFLLFLDASVPENICVACPI